MSSDTPSIWFMFDNHTFRKIQPGWPDRAIFNELRACFDEDGSGHVFVRHWSDGPIEPSLSLCAYDIRPGKYFVTDDEITDWLKRFRAFTFETKPPTYEELRRDLAAMTARAEAAERDSARLARLVEFVDGIGSIDLHEQAAIYASHRGNEEPDASDYLAAARDAMDAAREGAREGK